MAQTAGGLGVNASVVTRLYKLLVYDQGSFFVSHRDTEKVPGMFAALVIVLVLHLHWRRPSHPPPRSGSVARSALPEALGCGLPGFLGRLRARGASDHLGLSADAHLQPAASGQRPALDAPNYKAEQARLGELSRRGGAVKLSTDDEVSEKLI